MANAKIEIVGQGELDLIAELYSQVFRPAKQAPFFARRFLGRYNPLLMVASLEGAPVGFFAGFELKPNTFFEWLFGVLPPFRRLGIASQLIDAVHAWCLEHAYEIVRFECQNEHRPMLQLAISHEYDIVGIRWDKSLESNLVIFEKTVSDGIPS